FYYRGYALEYAQVASNWTLDTAETGLTWLPVTTQFEWMLPGTTVQFRFGNDPHMLSANLERSSGIFGGQGIDEIIYHEIGGVQIQLTGGEIQN
ncbi:MAG: hypothetical protein ACK5NX_03465, partial [Armatimonadota bacterium]